VPLAAGRGAWVHLAKGHATVNGKSLSAGDAAAMEAEAAITITASAGSEVLIFDLA
jgi:hypothetical protein